MLARLILEGGRATPPEVELSPGQSVTIGRNPESAVQIPRDDEFASRDHARVYFEEGRWRLRDTSRNGTAVGDRRVWHESTELRHGDLIGIGEARFRFALPAPDETTRARNEHPAPLGPAGTPPRPADTTSRLYADDWAALYRFMAGSGDFADPRALVREALEVVAARTRASLTGYLSMDPDDPCPKLVLPAAASVDPELSRQLTRRVRQEGRTVWLSADLREGADESLAPFDDALCLPLRVAGHSLGALHVYRLSEPFTEAEFRFCTALANHLAVCLDALRVRRSLRAENQRLRAHLSDAEELIGESAAMAALREQIRRAAPLNWTVLIRGESGSGKELVALALHRQSPRRDGPFVAFNCAGFSPTLIDSQLFGHRKGAFSGADADHPGLFAEADEGTLFLDEVGELSPEGQAKLLRVIERKGFTPLGGTLDDLTQPDVRVIAATNRDLDAEVRARRFREDLLFRLRELEIVVPPLRDHPEDIPALAEFFLQRMAAECRHFTPADGPPARRRAGVPRRPALTPEALRKLQGFGWPGNVRQLQAVLKAALVSTDGDVLGAEDIRLGPPGDSPAGPLPTLDLKELKELAVREAMRRSGGNVTRAAELLRCTRETVYKYLGGKGQPEEPGAG